MCKKNKELSKNCKRKKPINYFDESKFSIKYLHTEKKKILVYNCFKIIINEISGFKRTFEVYVTDEISLNYNPFINFKSINKYLILELKQLHKLDGVFTKYIVKEINYNR